MPITVHKLPPVLETYFLDTARTMPTAHWIAAGPSVGHLGSGIRRVAGGGIAAGWAMTVNCPAGDGLATYLALQYVRESISSGRWIMVVAPDNDLGNPQASLWSYMHTATAWEVGFVGAVVAGYVRDIDEIGEKLENDFSVFGYGATPLGSTKTPMGTVGAPVVINGVTVRAGDLIVGDSDGVVCVPRDEVSQIANACQEGIVRECNRLAAVREGHGAVDVLELQELLEGNVEWAE